MPASSAIRPNKGTRFVVRFSRLSPAMAKPTSAAAK